MQVVYSLKSNIALLNCKLFISYIDTPLGYKGYSLVSVIYNISTVYIFILSLKFKLHKVQKREPVIRMCLKSRQLTWSSTLHLTEWADLIWQTDLHSVVEEALKEKQQCKDTLLQVNVLHTKYKKQNYKSYHQSVLEVSKVKVLLMQQKGIFILLDISSWCINMCSILMLWGSFEYLYIPSDHLLKLKCYLITVYKVQSTKFRCNISLEV